MLKDWPLFLLLLAFVSGLTLIVFKARQPDKEEDLKKKKSKDTQK